MSTRTPKSRQLRDSIRRLVVANGSLEEATRPCGAPLSIPHAYALLELLQSQDAMTITELAERLAIDRTNVSRLCQRMHDAGEVTRHVSPDDARSRIVRLTSQGRKLALSVDESSRRHFSQLAETLGEAVGPVITALTHLERAMLSKKGKS